MLKTLLSEKKNGSIDSCDVHAGDRAPKAPRAVWAQYAECSGHFQ